MDKLTQALDLFDQSKSTRPGDSIKQLETLLASMSEAEKAVYDLITMAYCKGEDRAHLMITGTPA